MPKLGLVPGFDAGTPSVQWVSRGPAAALSAGPAVQAEGCPTNTLPLGRVPSHPQQAGSPPSSLVVGARRWA